MLYTSDMLEDILGDTTLTSADFMAGKMLQEGGVGGKWMGVNWIPYEKLNQGAAVGELRTVMYAGSAAHFGDANITGFDISKRPDKRTSRKLVVFIHLVLVVQTSLKWLLSTTLFNLVHLTV